VCAYSQILGERQSRGKLKGGEKPILWGGPTVKSAMRFVTLWGAFAEWDRGMGP
jgi:hypothetical protein